MIIDRRLFLAGVAGTGAAALVPATVFAQTAQEEPRHGLSAFGDLKYGRDFRNFDYASPDAPMGGAFHFQPSYWYFNQNTQTFNTFNSFVRRGDAPPRMEMCFDTLMVTAWDEPDAVYCHLAETVAVSDDGNRFTFTLRPIARWHDGSPITAEDVKFSYETLKANGHPQLALPLVPLTAVEASGQSEVTLVFDGSQSAQDILTIAAGTPILAKAWYADKGFDESTLTPPLASGPYRVGQFSAGRFVEYDRVDDYWARDLGTARGLSHFGTIRIDFYQERQAGFEAFKKGDTTWREEFTSKTWATEYNFPAIEDDRVVKTLFDGELRPSMQAWAVNTRRERFADRRVRDAIALCFDFKWTNANLFYDAYAQSHSQFAGSPYEAKGAPDPSELALINRLSGTHSLPDGLREEAYLQPASDGSGRDRSRLADATRLLAEAGWSRGASGMLENEAGETLDLEILIRSSVFERILGPFVETMRLVGINGSIRLVDPAQFQSRTATFDFDMCGMAMSWGATPTRSSLEGVFGSASASAEGSRNWTGTADPLIDALIVTIGEAKTRDEHRTAMRVLDRVLRLKREWIPNWTSANHRVAYWDMFGFKPEKPDYFWPVEALWWYDEAKAKAIGKA